MEDGNPPPRTTAYRHRKKMGLVKPRKRAAAAACEPLPTPGPTPSSSTGAPESAPAGLLYDNSRISMRESFVILENIPRLHPTMNKAMLSSVLDAVRAHLPVNADAKHLDSMYKYLSIKKVRFRTLKYYILLLIRNMGVINIRWLRPFAWRTPF